MNLSEHFPGNFSRVETNQSKNLLTIGKPKQYGIVKFSWLKLEIYCTKVETNRTKKIAKELLLSISTFSNLFSAQKETSLFLSRYGNVSKLSH